MSELIPFQFETHAIRVYTDAQGDPWWVAQDICDILGLRNVSDAVGRLEPDEKRDGLSIGETDTSLIINESGLYRLIFRSNRPDAKRFQKWVYKEVLPALRKTGHYAVKTDPDALVNQYPELRAIRELLVTTAEARHAAEQAQATAHAAELRATRAETKADMALADAHRMTIEEFVCANGLLRQFPETTWAAGAKWLGRFCGEWGLEIHKVPVPAKSWERENAYPIQALMAWQRHATRLRTQSALSVVSHEPRGKKT